MVNFRRSDKQRWILPYDSDRSPFGAQAPSVVRGEIAQAGVALKAEALATLGVDEWNVTSKA